MIIWFLKKIQQQQIVVCMLVQQVQESWTLLGTIDSEYRILHATDQAPLHIFIAPAKWDCNSSIYMIRWLHGEYEDLIL